MPAGPGALPGWGRAPGSLLCALPEAAQFAVEFSPALLRKEDARACQFHQALGARKGFGQPAAPLDAEIDIIGAPYDQCRRFQRLQIVFDRKRMLVVERRQET